MTSNLVSLLIRSHFCRISKCKNSAKSARYRVTKGSRLPMHEYITFLSNAKSQRKEFSKVDSCSEARQDSKALQSSGIRSQTRYGVTLRMPDIAARIGLYAMDDNNLLRCFMLPQKKGIFLNHRSSMTGFEPWQSSGPNSATRYPLNVTCLAQQQYIKSANCTNEQFERYVWNRE